MTHMSTASRSTRPATATKREILADALTRHPDNREILTALVQISQQAGDLVSALRYAENLVSVTPNDQNLQRYVEELRRAVGR